ncbi:MAG TPA: hypothetical protein VF535_05265 [Allosphingosinicella sp.]
MTGRGTSSGSGRSRGCGRWRPRCGRSSGRRRGTAEEEEALEAVYLARLGDHSAALRRLMKVRAPHLAALALKIEIAIDQEVASLSGGELCLAALRRDVRRLMR